MSSSSSKDQVPKLKKILLLGSGGREHALAWKFSLHEQISKIFVIPGNAGIASTDKVECCSVRLPEKDENNYEALIKFCREKKVDIVVVGPEEHLEKGIVEKLRQADVFCFGPDSAAAKLETSKAFAKSFMQRNQIPTARFATFTSSCEAIKHIESCSYKALVVKASGLAAGKGVFVGKNTAEACQAVREALDERKFKDAGSEIVVEEFLEGQEISALAFTDGYTVKMMPFSQDHKQLSDGDVGPNTGGMGAYAPVEVIDRYAEIIQREILQKTVDSMRKEGILYRGVLYAGIMLTKNGPINLEFNCRFGDPETQVLLRLLDSNLFDIMHACTQGSLKDCKISWKENEFVCGVVMASGGYPGKYEIGFEIFGFDELAKYEKTAVVFHAGTKFLSDGLQTDVQAGGDAIRPATPRYATAGGRVLCVTAQGPDLGRAYRSAYCACARLRFSNCTFRHDIGAKSLKLAVTYSSSGVSIDGGNDLVQKIKRHCASTVRPGSSSEGIGGFGGTFALQAAGYHSDAILVSGTDGVGTKLKIAQEYGKHETIGIDLVAMCVNDILVHNAEPLFFLDYYATGKLDVETATQVIKGISQGCKEANCALIGGETAEMPGFYEHADYDLAGFAVGAVNAADANFPYLSRIKKGDVVLGMASSGLHSNGFSLVRKIVCDVASLKYGDQCPWTSELCTVGDELLKPTKIYVKSLLPVLRCGQILAAAHITGGGLLENIPRVLPKNFGVHLDVLKWHMPEIFKWLAGTGCVSQREMVRTLNCGIGMVLVTTRENAAFVCQKLIACGEVVFEIGHVTSIHEGQEPVIIDGLDQIFPPHPLKPRLECHKVRVAVLISGTGTNFKSLLDHSLDSVKKSCFAIQCVVCNRADAPGLQYAREKGIPYKVISHVGKSREEFDDEVDVYLEASNTELVVLAGFMRILSEKLVKKWQGRMLNIHPSLLPSFKGSNAIAQVLKAGVRVTGSTVHFVAAEVDSGGIVAQGTVPVYPGRDTEDTLSDRVKKMEHRMYPTAVELVASGKVLLDNESRVFFSN